KYRNVVRVIVGNEALGVRNEVTVEQMIAMLDHVRSNTKRPVSTAEPWHVWLKYPELADHVDYLAVHMLPFWEGVPHEAAVDYVSDKMQRLEKAFPDKKIIIGEVGWPSEGRTLGQSVASVTNEATFLRRFLTRAQEEGWVYYVMEAFDQPWKANDYEGAIGAYWGVYDAFRRPKFQFTDDIVRMPQWHLLAGISVAISALLLAVFFSHSNALGYRGRVFLAIVVYATATASVWIVYDYSQQYLTLTTVLIGSLLVIGMLGVIAVLLAEAHEWAEAHWVSKRVRMLAPGMAGSHFPKVSVQVPAYNEPPDMLIQTIDALVATIDQLAAANEGLHIEGILRTMYDPRNNLSTEVSGQLLTHFGDVVFRTVIPRNIRLAEAPSFGRPVLLHDRDSRGALAYLALAGEIIRREEEAALEAAPVAAPAEAAAR
ncbi:MAG: hypothetical protein EOP08_10885, partial [Proteobacteria bacterium]